MQGLRHLGKDRNRDFPGAASAEGQPGRAVDARQIGLADSPGTQALDAFGVGLPAAERRDVEGVRLQRGFERRVGRHGAKPASYSKDVIIPTLV